jgi:hypothetical protein
MIDKRNLGMEREVKVKESAGQITMEMKNFQDAIARLDNMQTKLEKLLNPVLRNRAPTVSSDTEKEEYVVPLAAEIRGCRYQIEHICTFAGEIIDRLEL